MDKPPLHDRIRDALAYNVKEMNEYLDRQRDDFVGSYKAVTGTASGGAVYTRTSTLRSTFGEVCAIALDAIEHLEDLQEGYDEMTQNLHDLNVAIDQEMDKRAQLSAAHEMLHGMANHVIAELDKANKQRIVKMLAQRGRGIKKAIGLRHTPPTKGE